jgi:hypothetical protein
MKAGPTKTSKVSAIHVSIEVIVSDEHALRAPVVWQIQKDERGDPTQEQEA